MSSVLRAEAMRDAKRGRSDDDLELLSLHFHLTETLAHEPGLISQLCRYAMLRTGFESINAVLATAQPLDAELAGLKATLKQISLSDSMRIALLGERVVGIICCEQFPPWLTDENTEDESRVVLPTEGAIFALAFLQLNRLNFLRHAEWVLSLSCVPYRDIARSDLRKLDDAGSGSTNLFAMLLSPSSGAMVARDTTIAAVNQAIIAIDIELYRRQHGGFPKALEDLRVADPAIRLEGPFSGEPMRYPMTSGGYRMWSIGQDLRDDGGKPGKQRDDGDIVWEVNLDSPGQARNDVGAGGFIRNDQRVLAPQGTGKALEPAAL